VFPKAIFVSANKLVEDNKVCNPFIVVCKLVIEEIGILD
jgi:hypothetical protein